MLWNKKYRCQYISIINEAIIYFSGRDCPEIETKFKFLNSKQLTKKLFQNL